MDICKCEGRDCPHKEKCYRFTAKASEWQTYAKFDTQLLFIPSKECEHFWEINK